MRSESFSKVSYGTIVLFIEIVIFERKWFKRIPFHDQSTLLSSVSKNVIKQGATQIADPERYSDNSKWYVNNRFTPVLSQSYPAGFVKIRH